MRLKWYGTCTVCWLLYKCALAIIFLIFFFFAAAIASHAVDEFFHLSQSINGQLVLLQIWQLVIIMIHNWMWLCIYQLQKNLTELNKGLTWGFDAEILSQIRGGGGGGGG